MSLFMDVHNIEGGVSAADVAGAHEADLATQGAYGVNYLRYWVAQEAGKIFCLVEAPDAETANTVHREAHGLVVWASRGDGILAFSAIAAALGTTSEEV